MQQGTRSKLGKEYTREFGDRSWVMWWRIRDFNNEKKKFKENQMCDKANKIIS